MYCDIVIFLAIARVQKEIQANSYMIHPETLFSAKGSVFSSSLHEILSHGEKWLIFLPRVKLFAFQMDA